MPRRAGADRTTGSLCDAPVTDRTSSDLEENVSDLADVIEVMITVKAAPEISTSYGETVCVAGVRCDESEPSWVRLFPVPYATFHGPAGFKKYDHIRLSVQRHPMNKDYRPESRRPDLVTAERLGHFASSRAWQARREILDGLPRPTMCELVEAKGINRPSLAVVKPAEVLDLEVDDLRDDADFQRKQRQAQSHQLDLFTDESAPEIELCPIRFRYHYLCESADCRGHHQSILDWELSESWRTWPNSGEDDLLRRIRHKWLAEMCGPAKDTRLFVGNQHKSPQAFMVLGVFWPPATPDDSQLGLDF
jgi:hypothetical protein